MTSMTFDTALPVVFMALMGVSMLIYVVSDGYDLGVGMLMARATAAEKDKMVASIGPFWDANETWLVLGVGILLIAFPRAHGVVLGELYTQVRTWESAAPESEKMTPPVMARLWNQSLDAVESRKDSARDAWGRRLRLHRLPADLLALTEPRSVVINGTRLPEDTQNWSQWVAKEKP